jgi:hypothetical protein
MYLKFNDDQALQDLFKNLLGIVPSDPGFEMCCAFMRPAFILIVLQAWR